MQTAAVPSGNMDIASTEVYLSPNATIHANSTTIISMGLCRGHPARFIEKRQLECHSRASVDVHVVSPTRTTTVLSRTC